MSRLPSVFLASIIAATTLPSTRAQERVEAGEPSNLKGYCGALATSLADAEKAVQMQVLEDLETKLKQRISELSLKSAELREALRQREDIARKADALIVEIYAKMKPEAAAAQLSAMEEPIAAALLTKLNVRAASAILNEISPERAARLTEAMGATVKSTGKKS